MCDILECEDYAEHYDATQGKGLCWSGDGKPVYIYEAQSKNGHINVIDTLWCFECYAAFDCVTAELTT